MLVCHHRGNTYVLKRSGFESLGLRYHAVQRHRTHAQGQYWQSYLTFKIG